MIALDVLPPGLLNSASQPEPSVDDDLDHRVEVPVDLRTQRQRVG
jgi:hypothetical protein